MTTDRLFDVRVLERNLQKGLLTKEEFDKYVASLEDAEKNATNVVAEFVEGVLKDRGEEE